jgi:hypothetical protein
MDISHWDIVETDLVIKKRNLRWSRGYLLYGGIVGQAKRNSKLLCEFKRYGFGGGFSFDFED